MGEVKGRVRRPQKPPPVVRILPANDAYRIFGVRAELLTPPMMVSSIRENWLTMSFVVAGSKKLKSGCFV